VIRLNTLINATFQVPVCTSRTTMSSNMIKFVCLNSLLVTRLARCPLTQPGLETAHKDPPCVSSRCFLFRALNQKPLVTYTDTYMHFQTPKEKRCSVSVSGHNNMIRL